MDKVTGDLISKYICLRQSLAAGNSVAALNGEIRTLRHCFNLAEEWALIPKAPVIHELPGKVNRERVITFEEQDKYLGPASANLRDITVRAVDTGLRPNSELFTLKWANVHTKTHPPRGQKDTSTSLAERRARSGAISR